MLVANVANVDCCLGHWLSSLSKSSDVAASVPTVQMLAISYLVMHTDCVWVWNVSVCVDN